MLDLLADVHSDGATLIVATHDLTSAGRAERLIALRAGRVTYDGAPDAADVELPVEREEEDQRKVLGGPVCDAFSALVLEMRDDNGIVRATETCGPRAYEVCDLELAAVGTAYCRFVVPGGRSRYRASIEARAGGSPVAALPAH